MHRRSRPESNCTVDPTEVARFDAAATNWWDPRGEARWLHKYNRVRLPYVRDAACRRFDRDRTQPDCLHGLRILDIGCGAGVLCEPLAELGATMVGADPAEAIINTAELHARMSGLSIDYRCTTAEALANAGETFEVVLAMEVVEHVADSSVFLQVCAKLVSPGGLMILSTINRTFKSFAFAIVAAEYVLRLLPRGAHQWGRFRTPDEIGATMERNGLTVTDVSGVTLNLLSRDLQVSAKTDVNYVLTAERPAAPHAR